MTPSPLPPFSGLSYSASARKPLRPTPRGGCGCGEKLPKSSAPLSIDPLPLRSSASHASSEAIAVHAVFSATVSSLTSKLTPPCGSVKENPLPETSIRIGELLSPLVPEQVQVSKSNSPPYFPWLSDR